MPGASFQVMDIVSPGYIHGYGRAPGSVAGDELPFRIDIGHQLAADALLDSDGIVQADVLHQQTEPEVVVPQVPFVRREASVPIEDSVGGLRLDGELVYVDHVIEL